MSILANKHSHFSFVEGNILRRYFWCLECKQRENDSFEWIIYLGGHPFLLSV